MNTGDTRHLSKIPSSGKPGVYRPRTYRNQIRKEGLAAFRVVVKETDLHIQADRQLEKFTRDRVLYYRDILEKYIQRFPSFASSMAPWQGDEPRPFMIEEMIQAGRKAGTGPMAAVAGAIAACVGNDLLEQSNEVILENGGDVYMKTSEPLIVGIYAGTSPLSLKIGLRVGGGDSPLAVCTSSGTVGHSHSFGRADAVCVVSASCALADAAATSIGNYVSGEADIRSAIERGNKIQDIQGIVIVSGEKIGAWGPLELVKL